MAATQEIPWETETNPHKQSAFKSLFKKYAFSNPFASDPMKPKKRIWEKNPFSSITATNNRPIGNEENVENTEIPQRRPKRNRIILGVVFILILVLIIGLAVGLTRKGYVNLNTITPRPF